MTTMNALRGERIRGDRLGAEWTARELRPVARWTSIPDETGRPRLAMSWSVPEVTPMAVAGVRNSDSQVA